MHLPKGIVFSCTIPLGHTRDGTNLHVQHIVLFFFAVAFVAFQCVSGVRGKVIAVKGIKVVIYFQDPDSVKTGEEFSLWRDRM